MMSLDDLWQTLFDAEITEGERRVMTGVEELCGTEEPASLVVAVTVHSLFRVLLLDPGSPVRIAARINRAVASIEAKLTRLDDIANRLAERFATRDYQFREVSSVLDHLRYFDEERRKNRVPIFKMRPGSDPDIQEFQLSFDIYAKIGVTAFIAGLLGALAALGIGMHILGRMT